jgi:hypothetical protein
MELNLAIKIAKKSQIDASGHTAHRGTSPEDVILQIW